MLALYKGLFQRGNPENINETRGFLNISSKDDFICFLFIYFFTKGKTKHVKARKNIRMKRFQVQLTIIEASPFSHPKEWWLFWNEHLKKEKKA